MFNTAFAPTCLALACLAFSAVPAAAATQACECGGYLNPQLFNGDTASVRSITEQEMRSFIGTTGLPAAPVYSIKQIDEVTSSGRAPFCWIYANQVIGLMCGYKPVVVNTEPGQQVVLVISSVVAGGQKDAGTVPLKSLSEKEQLAVLDQLKRSKCIGTAGGADTEIVKAEGLCAFVISMSPQSAVGQQGLIARAAYEWDDQTWAGVVTRNATVLKASVKGFAGKSENVHLARLVTVPTQGTSMGFGLYMHPSVPDAVTRKAVAAFQNLAAPSTALAIALDLGSKFAFAIPASCQVDKMTAAIGFRK